MDWRNSMQRTLSEFIRHNSIRLFFFNKICATLEPIAYPEPRELPAEPECAPTVKIAMDRKVHNAIN